MALLVRARPQHDAGILEKNQHLRAEAKELVRQAMTAVSKARLAVATTRQAAVRMVSESRDVLHLEERRARAWALLSLYANADARCLETAL